LILILVWVVVWPWKIEGLCLKLKRKNDVVATSGSLGGKRRGLNRFDFFLR
jgi:hypothetical protein